MGAALRSGTKCGILIREVIRLFDSREIGTRTETNTETEEESCVRQYHNLPQNERAALAAIADAVTVEEKDQAISDYCRLRNVKRLYQRRRGEEDRYRRTMLAIHVPFDYALEVARRADAEGISVYAWMRRAVDRALS